MQHALRAVSEVGKSTRSVEVQASFEVVPHARVRREADSRSVLQCLSEVPLVRSVRSGLGPLKSRESLVDFGQLPTDQFKPRGG